MRHMTTKDLREKYDAPNAKNAINKAIRAELPGGNEAIEAREQLHLINQASRSRDTKAALALVSGIIAAMEAEIRRRYGMPPAE